MKTWYYAVCQEHGEAIDIFVSNPSCTEAYLSQYDEQIQAWLECHIACDLLMIGNDLQKEKYIYDLGWIEVGSWNGVGKPVGMGMWMRP